MSRAEDIGGYMELEHHRGPMLHEGALALNSARNCLAYLIEARRIRRIALPFFLCDSVARVCESHQVEIRFYRVGEDLLPADAEVFAGEWLYLVNYYGRLTRGQIRSCQKVCPRLIVDNVQAYFEEPVPGVDTIYSCRKFFGVPDGAFLYTDARLDRELKRDVSFDRMAHILGRYDTRASDHYACYTRHEKAMEDLPLRRMSKLTENLLRSVDYGSAKRKRTENYAYLADHLGGRNRLGPGNAEGAFAYPLWMEDGASARKKLIENKVYVPLLWPNAVRQFPADQREYDLAVNILPLPCDQRYGESEMEYICSLLVGGKTAQCPQDLLKRPSNTGT